MALLWCHAVMLTLQCNFSEMVGLSERSGLFAVQSGLCGTDVSVLLERVSLLRREDRKVRRYIGRQADR